MELLLSKGFASKAFQFDDDWARMSKDKKNPLNKISTFYLPSSSDGYGFKVYQNQGNEDVVVEFKGTIDGGKMSIFNPFNLIL